MAGPHKNQCERQLSENANWRYLPEPPLDTEQCEWQVIPSECSSFHSQLFILPPEQSKNINMGTLGT
jgi:hypothetical protein